MTTTPFTFTSAAMPDETFLVAEFSGYSALSKPYSFDILLLSKEKSLNMETMLSHWAALHIHVAESPVVYHGVPIEFTRLYTHDKYTYYRATLTPRIELLSLAQTSKQYINKDIFDIIYEVLQTNGLSDKAITLRLAELYEAEDYVCQYEENDLAFISRLMENYGLYYFFTQDEECERMTITDSYRLHTLCTNRPTLYYSPISGMENKHSRHIVHAFNKQLTHIPSRVTTRNYEYAKPSRVLEGNYQAQEQNELTTYLFGENLHTEREANKFAQITGEMLTAETEVYTGKSSIPYIMPGKWHELEDHFDSDLNQTYLIVSTTQHGIHPAFRKQNVNEQKSEQIYYTNEFTAIPNNSPYRPQRTTPTPSIGGVVQANIKSESAGQYAELDAQGRYRLEYPFAPAPSKSPGDWFWVRKAQPYAGKQCGMHCPLHNDAEVLVSFAGGDPDRPIIIGSVPNPENNSPVTSVNQTQSIWKTAGENSIVMDDLEGARNISVATPTDKTWFRLGEKPQKVEQEGTAEDWLPIIPPRNGFATKTKGHLKTKASHCYFSFVACNRTEHIAKSYRQMILLDNIIFRLWKSSTKVKKGRIELHLAELDKRKKLQSAAKTRIQLAALHTEETEDKIEMLKHKISLLINEIEHYKANETTLKASIELINNSTETIETKSRRVKMLIELCNQRFPEITTATRDAKIVITAAQNLKEKTQTGNEKMSARVEIAESLEDSCNDNISLGDLVTIALSENIKIL